MLALLARSGARGGAEWRAGYRAHGGAVVAMARLRLRPTQALGQVAGMAGLAPWLERNENLQHLPDRQSFIPNSPETRMRIAKVHGHALGYQCATSRL